MKRIFLTAAFCLLSAAPLDAQPELNWWRLIDFDASEDCLLDAYRLADGGFVMTGDTYVKVGHRQVHRTWIAKFNNDLGLLWKLGYDMSSGISYKSGCIIEADNGDLLIPGGINLHFGALRADANGEKIWMLSYGQSRGTGDAIIELKSGNFVLAGEIHAIDLAGTHLRPHLAMIDGDGNLIWERTYDIGDIGIFTTLHEFDGDVVAVAAVSGYFNPLDSSEYNFRLFAVRVDDEGNDVWRRQYEDIGREGLDALSSVTSPDGGMVVTGTSYIHLETQGPYIIKIDSQEGDIAWFQRYEEFSTLDSIFMPTCIIRYGDGFVLVGPFTHEFYPSGFDAWPYALATDADGNIQWYASYRLGDLNPQDIYATFHGAVIGEDGSVIACGSAINITDPDNLNWDGLVAKIEPYQENPLLLFYQPEDTVPYRLPGDTLTFLVRAHDQQGDAMSYLWTFDGDTVGTDTTYFATFPDEYRECPVSCTVSDDKGNSTTINWHVNIVPFYIDGIQPDSTALVIKRRTSVDFGVTLRSVPGDQFDYLWRVGRDSSGVDSVMTRQFDYTGKSRVTVNVSRNDGWADTSWSVKVVGLIGDWWPQANDTTVTQGDSLYFDVLPYQPGDSTLAYRWTLNGDSISSDSAVIITFPDLGKQTVVGHLFASADSDSVSWRINVVPKEGVSPFSLSHFLTFSLDAPYPNPFNQSSVVRYQLSAGGKVNLALYDINGRLVETLVDGWQGAGEYKVEIGGQPRMAVLPAGIYLIRLKAEDRVITKKAVVIR